MPNVNVTIPETIETITRPVVYDIIKQVSSITKINKVSKVFFPGENTKMQTQSSSIDSDQERFPLFNTNYITYIEVNEDYLEENINSTAISRNEHSPIFLDPQLDIKISPIYVSTVVEINFKYTTPSRAEALRWRDDIRIKVSQMRDINLHDITYSYHIPYQYMTLLKVIWERRESIEPYGQSFEEYIRSNFTNRLTLVGDLVGKDARLVIPETQMRIIGDYDFDAVPEKPEKSDDGVWIINFSYKFIYDKPIACNMKYPIMVHNQLLPINYTNFVDKSYDLDKVSKRFTKSLNALHAFEVGTVMTAARDDGVVKRIPEVDDFIVKNHPVATGSIFIALVEVEEDKRTLLNLHELGDIVLDSDIVQFLEDGEYQYLTQTYKSIFNISLYRNDYLTSKETISIDSNLTVKATNDLNLRNQHRVRFSIVTDLTLLDPKAIERLRNNPIVLVKVIQSINKIFRNNVDMSYITRKKRISKQDFEIIFNLLVGFGTGNATAGSLKDITALGNLFGDIDPSIVEYFRQNKIQFNNQLNSSIIAVRR